MNSYKILRVAEYYKSPTPLAADERFSIAELEILEKEFSKYIQVISRHTGEQRIQTQEYVGYIVLPNHIISIVPKIPQISFINMLRYAIGLAKIIPDYFELAEETNYYDIVVLFFLNELEKLLRGGLNTGYKIYDDNLSCIRGKILFKEHLSQNYIRSDKIFCSYSELTTDILENRIIKYTLYYLSKGRFLDDTIDSKLLNYYNRLEQINPIRISSESFKIIEYTPLNEHYRTILALSELLLRDSSLDEETSGKKTAISYLVDMNTLFEKFVVCLLQERIKTEKLDVQEQEVRYADLTGQELQLKLDILISYQKEPILILDTKYMQFEGNPDISHVAQLALYSNSTGVQDCCLIYAGRTKEPHPYSLHHDIKLNILSFDLQATDRYEFKSRCDNFINSINLLLQPIIEKEES